ncbi:MAG: hypothetical protein ACM3SW_09495 [Actinomycetota bacterium]
MLAPMAFLAWAFYLATIAVRRRYQNAMQKALLDKFSSAHDFAEFMQSPAGQKYVMSFADSVTSPRHSILTSVQIGIILMFVGAGFFSAARGDVQGLAFIFGGGFVCVGFGFLVSALASYFISKKLDSKIKE